MKTSAVKFHFSTSTECGLINSIYCVGGLVGSLLYGFLVGRIGRLWAIQTTALTQMVSFIVIIIADTSAAILIARLLAGFADGAVYITVPMFVSEIASNK